MEHVAVPAIAWHASESAVIKVLTECLCCPADMARLGAHGELLDSHRASKYEFAAMLAHLSTYMRRSGLANLAGLAAASTDCSSA